MEDHIYDYLDKYVEHLESCNDEIKIKKQKKVGIHKKYHEKYGLNKNKIYTGDTNAIKYWKYVYTMKNVELYDFQEALLDEFFRISLSQLYYEEWDYNSKDILNMYDYDYEYKFHLYKTGRKEGKTFIATLHSVALALCCGRKEGFSISFCSLALKNAIDMMQTAYANLDYFVYDKTKIHVEYQQKKLELFFLDERGEIIGVSRLEARQSGKVNKIIICIITFIFKLKITKR